MTRASKFLAEGTGMTCPFNSKQIINDPFFCQDKGLAMGWRAVGKRWNSCQ
jgi:hypothetical protein